MSVFEKPSLLVNGLPDLIGVVPYLLGFHPEESLVMVFLVDGRVQVTARVDLVAVRDAAGLAPLLDRMFDRFPTAEAWFLAYTADSRAAWEVLASCTELVPAARLGRCLHIGAELWRADGPTGLAGPVGDTVSSAAVAAAVIGFPARASRRDLAALIAGPSDATVAELTAAFLVAAQGLPRAEPARRRLQCELLDRPEPLAVSESGQLAVLIQDPTGQLASLTSLAAANAEQRLDRWTAVARRCPLPWRPAVLGQLGMAAWQQGDGALQVVCLEELEQLSPGSELGLLLDWLNHHVVAPWEWPELKEPLLAALSIGATAVARPANRPHR